MESKFLRVKCPKCKTVQVLFGKASTRVKCRNCRNCLVKTRGGKAKIRASVEKVL